MCWREKSRENNFLLWHFSKIFIQQYACISETIKKKTIKIAHFVTKKNTYLLYTNTFFEINLSPYLCNNNVDLEFDITMQIMRLDFSSLAESQPSTSLQHNRRKSPAIRTLRTHLHFVTNKPRT